MDAQSVFMSLVKHELKWRGNIKKSRRRITKGWRLTYVAFFLLLVVIFTTYSTLNGHLHLDGTWYFTWGLPFMIFGVAIKRVRREWENETLGWWLTLPYSRSTLTASKFVASLLISLLYCLIIYSLVTLFGLYILLLSGNLMGHSFVLFILPGLKWFLLLIALSPFAASFGTFMGVLSHTKARPALPLIWVLFWAMFPIIGMRGYDFNHFGDQMAGMPYTWLIIIPILISWLFAYLLIRVAAYLLDKHLTL